MAAELVFSSYREILKAPERNDVSQWNTLIVPKFQESTLVDLIQKTNTFLSLNKSVIQRNCEAIIVGDVHGNLYDLIRIFHTFGLPPYRNYIFLGDYVDRGEFSLEVISLLYAMKVLYPDNITLIRGNHELPNVNAHYGFMEQCIETYGNTELWTLFNKSFTYLPLVCILNEKLFLVHGGISPKLNKVKSVEDIEELINSSSQLVEDLLWSDPMPDLPLFCENPRGKGCIYGCVAVQLFLKDTGFETIIRGHQCVTDGIQYALKRTVVTVFSSSNYGAEKNRCAVLIVSETEMEHVILPKVEKLLRINVNFYDAKGEDKNETTPIKNLGASKSKSVVLFGRNSMLSCKSSFRKRLTGPVSQSVFPIQTAIPKLSYGKIPKQKSKTPQLPKV